MTMLTQKKLNLQMKILKIAKGLNKFTLPDILPMLEENEKTIQKALNDLESLNQIKKISNKQQKNTLRLDTFETCIIKGILII